jgi:hypothetical protein
MLSQRPGFVKTLDKESQALGVVRAPGKTGHAQPPVGH